MTYLKFLGTLIQLHYLTLNDRYVENIYSNFYKR